MQKAAPDQAHPRTSEPGCRAPEAGWLTKRPVYSLDRGEALLAITEERHQGESGRSDAMRGARASERAKVSGVDGLHV
jgi:hypothetical protein